MRKILLDLTRPTENQEGQALAEYALVLAFIAIVCVAAVTAIGLAISGAFGNIAGSF